MQDTLPSTTGGTTGGITPRGGGALRPAPPRAIGRNAKAASTSADAGLPEAENVARPPASMQPTRIHRRRGKQQLPTRELVLITTQLCIQVGSGQDLGEALRSLSRRVQNPATSRALADLWRSIESGMAFSEALQAQAEVFGPTFAATVSAGEASGQLPNVLLRLKELLRNELKLRNTVRSMLVYPAVLAVVGSLVMTAMIFFVLPQFTKVYISMERPAPLFTQLLLDAGMFCRNWWWLLVSGAAVGALILWKVAQTPAAIRVRDRWVLSFPITSGVVRNLVTGRVFALIGTMLRSGVPLLEAMRLAASTVNNALFRELFISVESEILGGRPMAPLMAGSPCLPEGTSDLISTAETSGDLASVMCAIGDFYQEEGEQQLRSLVKILEPAIIVVMGTVVAGLVLAIMLPLIKLTSAGGR